MTSKAIIKSFSTITSFQFDGSTRYHVKCEKDACKIFGDTLFSAVHIDDKIMFKSKNSVINSNHISMSVELFGCILGSFTRNTKNEISTVTIDNIQFLKGIHSDSCNVVIDGVCYYQKGDPMIESSENNEFKLEYDFESLPFLEQIEMSGSSELTINESQLFNSTLNLETSGSSKFNSNLNTNDVNDKLYNLNIYSSGASKINIFAPLTKLNADTSDASNVKINSQNKISDANLDASGASTISADIVAENLKATTSGASSIINFSVEKTGILKANDASNIIGTNLVGSNIRKNTSGDASIKVQN